MGVKTLRSSRNLDSTQGYLSLGSFMHASNMEHQGCRLILVNIWSRVATLQKYVTAERELSVAFLGVSFLTTKEYALPSKTPCTPQVGSHWISQALHAWSRLCTPLQWKFDRTSTAGLRLGSRCCCCPTLQPQQKAETSRGETALLRLGRSSQIACCCRSAWRWCLHISLLKWKALRWTKAKALENGACT